MYTPKYKDLLGKEITYNGDKGFIAMIDPKVGLTIKPLDENDSREFLYCYDIQSPTNTPMKDVMKVFWTRIKFLRICDEFTEGDIILLQKAEGKVNAGLGLGSCPFSK